MMKLGVRAHDFGRHTPEILAGKVKDAGFGCVQLALTKAVEGVQAFPEVTPAVLEAVSKGFAKSNVEISVLGCYVEPSLPDREERQRHVGNFLLGLEHAKELGVPVVGTETTTYIWEESQREATYQNLKDSVLRMTEKAEALDIQIGIEPVADHTLCSPALARRLLDEVGSKKLKIILDPVNMLTAANAPEQEKVYQNFLELLGEEIVAIHVKDIVFEGEEKVWRNIGAGMVNYTSVMDWLHLNKPDIPLLREHVKMDSYAMDVAALQKLARLG